MPLVQWSFDILSGIKLLSNWKIKLLMRLQIITESNFSKMKVLNKNVLHPTPSYLPSSSFKKHKQFSYLLSVSDIALQFCF